MSDDVVRRYNGARPIQAPAQLLADAIHEIEVLRSQVEALGNERNRLLAEELKTQLEITSLREELYGANAEIDQFSGILADYKNAAASEAERANELTAENIALREENARLREALIDILASLVASVDLLERGGKKAAPSDKMFAQMLVDYKNSIERGRAVAAAIREGGKDE